MDPDQNSVFRPNQVKLEGDMGENCFRTEQASMPIKCRLMQPAAAPLSGRLRQANVASLDYGSSTVNILKPDNAVLLPCCHRMTQQG